MVSSFVALVLFTGSALSLLALSYLIVGGIENWRGNNRMHYSKVDKEYLQSPSMKHPDMYPPLKIIVAFTIIIIAFLVYYGIHFGKL